MSRTLITCDGDVHRQVGHRASAAAILTDPCPQERICEECGRLGGIERFETQHPIECSAPPRTVKLGDICDYCWDNIQQDLMKESE